MANFSIKVDPNSTDMIQQILDDAADEFMDELTEEIEWSWRRYTASESTLKSTRSTYLDAIEVGRDGDNITLQLNDPLAASLESGQNRFDLKPGFLGNRLHRVIPLVDAGTNNVTRFRTISTSSGGWKHPGIHPRSLTEKVMADVSDHLIGDVFSRVLSRSKV